MLSIIVPIYKTEKYLKNCIDSLLEQNLNSFEIILVDDGSPDNSPRICDEYASLDKRIKVIHKMNEGLGMARNSGIEIAQGDYITFLDSDDYVDKDFYKQLLSLCESMKLDICISGGFKQLSSKKIKTVYFNNISNVWYKSNGEIKKLISRIIGRLPEKDDVLCGSSCMMVYNTNFLRNNNLKFISERVFISEDIWFVMDCLNVASNIYYSDIVGYYYRYNENSLSRGYNPDRFKQLCNSIRLLFNKCKRLMLIDYYGRIAIYFWINFEKCINQEVRFNYSRCLGNIEKMCNNELSQQMIDYLVSKRFAGFFHILLCKFLKNKRYKLVVLLLSLYNLAIHRRHNLAYDKKN